VLHALWSDYQSTVHAVAEVNREETNLHMIQTQVYALTADNETTSPYSIWNYLSGQFPRINDSLQATSLQVSSISACAKEVIISLDFRRFILILAGLFKKLWLMSYHKIFGTHVRLEQETIY